MAEHAAHLTGTAYAKPSIFEIVAQKSLAATLEPAAKRIITFLASVNPEKYSWFYTWSDEIYLLFVATLQNYYLNNFSASFSETFYGLKRIIVRDSKVLSSLDKKRLYLSLVILVLVPYLQKKIDNWQNRSLDSSQQEKWKSHVSRIYKLLKSLHDFSTLYQYLLYLSNHSKYPTLSLRLLSITLTYASEEDEPSVTEILKKLSRGNFRASDAFEVARLSIVRSIEVGAFFLQFLQWWNEEHHYGFSLTKLPVPPPPKIPEFAKQFRGMCPICRQPPWIHTALTVSGFVYCYQCILAEVRKSKKCPVTGYPALEDHLVRLYVQ